MYYLRVSLAKQQRLRRFTMANNKNKLNIQDVLADLQLNHNHTWYEELYNRNSKSLSDTALFYRGNSITYGAMFEAMRTYAKALRASGIQEGDEIPICMTNIPELVYLLGAISIVGAKANIFGADFDKDYITEIIDGCSSDLLVLLDNSYTEIADAVNASKVQKIVMCSLVDSLPAGGNPYEQYDRKHGFIRDARSEHMAKNEKIISIDEFLASGTNTEAVSVACCGLDAEFVITYTSGSTNVGRPKAIVHCVRSFITMGRWHDPDIKKTSMKKYRYQAHIPCHSNTDIVTCISDSLLQGAQLALEPVYDKNFFLDSLFINKPNYVVATRSFWIQTAKRLAMDRNVKIPFLFLPFCVGEPLEVNEEAFVNRWLRKADAGKDIVPAPFSIVTLSTAGGDCEHGGIFYVLFRALQSMKPANLLKGQEQGMLPFSMIDVAVLDTEGNVRKPYQLGRLVANSPCTMKCYKNNPEATAAFFIKDATGKTWGDCRVYGYIDAQGGVHMKGRIPDRPGDVPLFQIAEAVLKDRKNILSCEVVEVGECYVAHVEFVPGFKQNQKSILAKAQSRCKKTFGKEVADRSYWRVRSNEESYPLTGCGKRSAKALVEEGITSNCFKFISCSPKTEA